jgi:hypothetical protein
MKKIIVFTRKSSINVAFDDFADEREGIKDLDGANATILLFDENEAKFTSVNDLFAWGLYLVYDGISETDFNKLITNLNKSEFYILKHSKPTFELSGFSIVEKGTTEKHDKNGKHYPVLIDVLSDENSEKVKRFFEQVFTYDPEEETLTDDIFNAIYEQKDTDAIEKAVSKRDKHIKGKGKN